MRCAARAGLQCCPPPLCAQLAECRHALSLPSTPPHSTPPHPSRCRSDAANNQVLSAVDPAALPGVQFEAFKL